MKIGAVIITCPGCGESLPVEIQPHTVTVCKTYIGVQFMLGSADHTCEGRQ